MNAVLLAVLVMLALSIARVHVVLSLLIGALVGGLAGGLGVVKTIQVFQNGLAGGATIALSYAMLGAFAMAIAHSGLPQALANWVVNKIEHASKSTAIKWGLLLALVAISISSQNMIPIHIAFIPLVVPPLLVAMTKLKLDRRAVACCLTFGLVTTYMFLPYGFGDIFLNKILLANIQSSGLDTKGINVMNAMLIPALGMVAGLLIAVFVTYRQPREYAVVDSPHKEEGIAVPITSPWRTAVALSAVVLAFLIQVKTDSMIVGALVGFVLFMVSGVVRWKEADDVFNQGVRMMALVGFIMISAQGFAEVMKATDQIKPMVDASATLFSGSKGMAALAMLVVGLIITMGIGSSFSTVPIIAAIYTPLCLSMGFSPLATVALIGAAGALGDAGSPASDSTLGPTAGLNVDGQHDHVRDTVIPTFLHFNIPVMIAGWIAAMVL